MSDEESVVRLSDFRGRPVVLYDVWRERTMYGKKRMGILRSTFVIGPDATVVKAMYGGSRTATRSRYWRL